jgi:hypothetical protein
MQRLFSMFPQGGPGIALVLLRVSVAGMALFSFRTYVSSLVPHWVLPGLLLISLSLCIGFLTPVLSVFFCIADTYLLLAGGSDSVIHVSAMLNAIALAFLGPGAYSLDARLYGRRVVTVSCAKPREKS